MWHTRTLSSLLAALLEAIASVSRGEEERSALKISTIHERAEQIFIALIGHKEI